MRWIVLAALGLAVACDGGHYHIRKVVRPDGNTWFVTSCRHIADCYDDAHDVCPGGYQENQDASRPHEFVFTCTRGKVNY